MDPLHISATAKTPEINFTSDGIFAITGNSYPEDVNKFYAPINTWVEAFLKTNTTTVNLNISLDYISTSSIKVLLSLITFIKSQSKSETKVTWLHEIDDEDSLATGKDLQSLSEVQFNFLVRES
ncbi:MAG: DUF1987 domain-containing protein [Bacteroidota bacterium]|nr:DUF1987 domain-containing protein [Bacteroidota bacterium]